MQITLQAQSSKCWLKIVCALIFGAYVTGATRDYLAFYLAASPKRQAIERAIVLEPSNAEYEWDLGSLFYGEQRPDLAIPHYQAAVTLNPYIPEYWLDLAKAYANTGAAAQEELALDRALEDDPNTPRITWEAANGFLNRGDLVNAFRLFRVLLGSGLSQTQTILQLCWYASDTDIDRMINDVLPPSPTVYAEFLHFLIAEQRTDTAEKVWARLIALQQMLDPQLAMPYVDYLIDRRNANSAQSAWNDIGRRNPDFRSYLPSADNLMVNGGFEEKGLKAGFDWRYPDAVTFTLDTQQFHSGTRSLSITFDGHAVVDIGVSQYIAISPGTRYDFSAFVKSDDVFTAEGPQFVITDPKTTNILLVTTEILGTMNWTRVVGSFETGPITNLVCLKLMRSPGSGPITGKLWIDDVVLIKD